jgi:hypothetical protein
VVEVVVLLVPGPDPGAVVVVCPVPPTPAPGRDVPVVEGEGDDVVVVVEVLGALVVGLAVVVDVVVGGVVVVVVVVGAGVTLVEPRHRPGARQTLPPPPLPGAAAEVAGGYRYHRVPKPTNATTISSVDRRIGSRRWTGTDMKPTRALCF